MVNCGIIVPKSIFLLWLAIGIHAKCFAGDNFEISKPIITVPVLRADNQEWSIVAELRNKTQSDVTLVSGQIWLFHEILEASDETRIVQTTQPTGDMSYEIEIVVSESRISSGDKIAEPIRKAYLGAPAPVVLEKGRATSVEVVLPASCIAKLKGKSFFLRLSGYPKMTRKRFVLSKSTLVAIE